MFGVGGGEGLGLRGNGPIAIIFSLVCIGLAAFSFLIDFDAADQMIRAGAPEKAAWGVALGLTVTLVWLYIEILRLLSSFKAIDDHTRKPGRTCRAFSLRRNCSQIAIHPQLAICEQTRGVPTASLKPWRYPTFRTPDVRAGSAPTTCGFIPTNSSISARCVITTVARTAFDVARRGRLDDAVARLDALGNATGFTADDLVSFADRHRGARGLRQLRAALDLYDPGAQSPKETWLRLLMIRAGYPRPQTQIPVLSADGCRRYYLDMGWEDMKLAVEYDGEQHRVDPIQFAYDIQRSEDLDELGWTRIRVVQGETVKRMFCVDSIADEAS